MKGFCKRFSNGKSAMWGYFLLILYATASLGGEDHGSISLSRRHLHRRVSVSAQCTSNERTSILRTLARLANVSKWALAGVDVHPEERDEFAEAAFEERFIDSSVPEHQRRIGTARSDVRRRFSSVRMDILQLRDPRARNTVFIWCEHETDRPNLRFCRGDELYTTGLRANVALVLVCLTSNFGPEALYKSLFIVRPLHDYVRFCMLTPKSSLTPPHYLCPVSSVFRSCSVPSA